MQVVEEALDDIGVDYKKTTNSKVYRRIHRKKFTGCDRCPPHGGADNTTYRGKYPVKKAYQLDANRRHRTLHN